MKASGSAGGLEAMLSQLAEDTGLSEEAVWSVAIMKLLEEAGELDRHSLRLLKPFLPDEAERESLAQAISEALAS